MKQVVFDFDKTLTQHDTFFPFLKYATKSSGLSKLVRILLYRGLGLAYRMRFISNDTLKNCAIRLFIYNYTSEEINSSASGFWQTITFHQKTFDRLLEHINNPSDKVYIATASLNEYACKIQDIGPDLIVCASELQYHLGRVKQLKFNNYQEQKLKYFGDKEIDLLYTDSLSDLPLAQKSKKIVLVLQNGELEELKDVEHLRFRLRNRSKE